MNPSDLPFGLLVSGRVHDRVGHTEIDWQLREFIPDPSIYKDGSRLCVPLEIADFAGNVSRTHVEFEISTGVSPRWQNLDRSANASP